MAGDVTYAFDPEAIRFEPSHVFTEDTYVAFEGATAYGERSKIAVSRHQPQLAGERSLSRRHHDGVRRADASAIPIDGVGKFDGVMLGAFRRPRIEGRFTGSEMRAWDVNWGDVDGDFVVENSYANVSRAVIRQGLSRMDVTGQFSLGYPRADGGEEIDARIRVTERPMVDFREAFDLQDYDVDGMLSGDFHVYGDYEGPHGFGSMTIARGIAYDEPFSEATASLQFEGEGVRLNGIEMHEGRRHGERRRLCRLGRHLFVRRRRPQPRRRHAGADRVSGLSDALRVARLHGDRQRHVRRAALRRASGASATCSSATKASAR